MAQHPEQLAANMRALHRLMQRGAARPESPPLHFPVRELRDFLNQNSPIEELLITAMAHIPLVPPFNEDPFHHPTVRRVDVLLSTINDVITAAPEFSECGLVGFPLNALVNWVMATKEGHDFFKNHDINRLLTGILNEWGAFLRTATSCETLHTGPGGWFSPEALRAMCNKANEPSRDFTAIFNCPSDDFTQHLGFACWNDFFTRLFRPDMRPVANGDDVIANACESAPLRLVRGVRATDDFWLKEQPYSLKDMFNNMALAQEFEGGTVYQAFLSALSYHRWHAPISGTIRLVERLGDTLYVENRGAGFEGGQAPDSSAPDRSQPYIAHMAKRALIVIDADNAAIGAVAFLAVGMAEVSSNLVAVTPGQHVIKGEELGRFQYGGSTHCLVFRPGVELVFELPNGLQTDVNQNVNSLLARVVV